MKKITFLFLFLFLSFSSIAQAPEGFNYQATVRNSAGNLLVNQSVLFRFKILVNSDTTSPAYTETHITTTDDLGQVSLVIGQGVSTEGDFEEINWGNNAHYLSIELNTGSGFVSLGSSQLLSVPYALYSNRSGLSEMSQMNLSQVLFQGNEANGEQIKGVADPTDNQDVVTLSYLMNQIAILQDQITSLQTQLEVYSCPTKFYLWFG